MPFAKIEVHVCAQSCKNEGCKVFYIEFIPIFEKVFYRDVQIFVP